MENTDLSPEIGITSVAANKVQSLISSEGDPSLCLQVYITGGGCSGFQYGFKFSNKKNPEDYVFNKRPAEDININILVDPLSMTYLDGATIDYKQDLKGSYFTVINPNADTTCSCGSSFSIA